MARSSYTDDERVEVLAALDAAGGDSHAPGIPAPPSTARAMRAAAAKAAPERAPADWADIYGRVAIRAAEILNDNLDRYAGMQLDPKELHYVAVIAGIAADKHLNYRDGRVGTSVNVDNRQVHLDRLTDAELDALAAAVQRPALGAPEETKR